MELTLKLPDRVRQDALAYRGQVARFIRGELSPMAFRAYRVPMGIYEQRTPETYMVRIRIGGGIASSRQLKRVAELSRTFGNGIVHVTTRQDLQIHDVKIEQTADVLEGLLEVGLSSRGGGGNTVRNVTACPRAGICPLEQFDVAPYAVALAEYLLQFDSSYNLPRKYKIAFSGCSQDCAYASVADLGFFAHIRDGVRGFSVYGGGGLGSNPTVGIKLEAFVKDSEIFEVAEAVKKLFDKHGDRANKHKARLRYVLARFGPAAFVDLYKQERERIRREGLDGRVADIEDAADTLGCADSSSKGAQGFGPPTFDLLPEREAGCYTVKLTLPLGDIPADDLVKIAQAAENHGVGSVRTTQQQDLLIPSVPKTRIADVQKELQDLNANVLGNGLLKVVACAGASTCKLGLCLSRGLADAITDKLAQTAIARTSQATIRISGCPNSCGHHYLGDIGFQGRAKRVRGRLLPCYDILAGARIAEEGACLAERIGTLPAKVIPEFVSRLLEKDCFPKGQLKELVEQYGDLSAEEIPEDYYFDWGSDAPFSLAGRGPGECGAGVMDVIAVDIDEAKEGLSRCSVAAEDDLKSQELYRVVLASTRALLIIFGLEPKTDREILDAFRKHMIEPGWVDPAAQGLLNEAMDWRLGDKETLAGLLSNARTLVERIEQLYLSLDANLRFRLEPLKASGSSWDAASPSHKVDLRGVPCPLNFVKAKLELEKVDVGEVLEIQLDEGEPTRNVPGSFVQQGQEVLAVVKVADHVCIRVRRKK
jgi:sulfite reductase (ferredoxin)